LHITGETSAIFARLTNPQQVQQVLGRIDNPDSLRPREALLCLNDDIQTGHVIVEKLLTQFMRDQWPTLSPWEKDVQNAQE
jgi:hypothetical protein